MRFTISYIGSVITEKDLFMLFLAFIMYYAILFLEAYVGLHLFLHSTDKNLLKDVNFYKDKNQFKKAYKNIILSYIAGFASVPFYVIVSDIANKRNTILSLLSFPNTFLAFPFFDRTLPDDLIYYTAIIVSFIVGVVIHYFFTFKKIEISKVKRVLSALILSLLGAPYFLMFTYAYF